MNTPADQEHPNLRYAEYVLGVLDADARAAVAHEVMISDEAAGAVALWQRRLLPLADTIAQAAPPPEVWARIRDELQFDRPARHAAPARAGVWHSLPFWRWLGVGATAVALALLVIVNLPPRAPAPIEAPASYLAATIQQDDGSTAWVATMDPRHARMVVVPGAPVAFAPGKAPELWLIPAGGKPISVGMIATDKATTITLDPTVLAKLGTTAALAVSVEPPGGSPTGQPTGAVIAKGVIEAAAPGTAHKVAVRGNEPTQQESA